MSDYVIVNGELYHHGVKGMKWGVHRYQNKDGSLTDAGKRRAIKQEARQYRKELYSDFDFTRKLAKEESENWKKERLEEAGLKNKGLTDKQRTAIKVGAAVATTALVAYGGYKLYRNGSFDALINAGSNKANELMKTFGHVKTTEISRVPIKTVEISRTPIKTSKIKAQDLSAGTELLRKMSKNGTNIRRELKNNQWMSEDINKLADSINNVKKVNAKMKDLGMPVDDSVLAKMELAYLIRSRSG